METLTFVPEEDFWSDATGSYYISGLRYTARSEELRKLVEVWASAGKVRFVDVKSDKVVVGKAEVSG